MCGCAAHYFTKCAGMGKFSPGLLAQPRLSGIQEAVTATSFGHAPEARMRMRAYMRAAHAPQVVLHAHATLNAMHTHAQIQTPSIFP